MSWADEMGRYWYRPHGGDPVEIPHPPIYREPGCGCAACAGRTLEPPRPRTNRVVDRLRVLYPEETWRYEHPFWMASSGWRVARVAKLGPDGEDSFRIAYERLDTGEEIRLDTVVFVPARPDSV